MHSGVFIKDTYSASFKFSQNKVFYDKVRYLKVFEDKGSMIKLELFFCMHMMS